MEATVLSRRRSSDAKLVLARQEGDVDKLLHQLRHLGLLALEPPEPVDRDPRGIVLARLVGPTAMKVGAQQNLELVVGRGHVVSPPLDAELSLVTQPVQGSSRRRSVAAATRKAGMGSGGAPKA